MPQSRCAQAYPGDYDFSSLASYYWPQPGLWRNESSDRVPKNPPLVGLFFFSRQKLMSQDGYRVLLFE